MILNRITRYKTKYVEAAPLAVFRVLFGVIMAFSMVRIWYHGWIEKLYLLPKFHFHYSGFDFISVPGKWTYLLFLICFLSSIFIAIGYHYKIAIVLFFSCFTYIELMDKTTYLNHYYFISIVSFIMIWLPSNVYFSYDAFRNKNISAQYIPKWTIDCLKVILAIVYIYAGLAKLNYDWLFRAMPLTIWLPTKFDIPLLGEFIHQKWLHFAFSWTGAVYDLTIVFLLMWKRTRVLAFIAVIIFHVLTRVLFPIGMFPYIMIASTLIFFSHNLHKSLLSKLAKLWNGSLDGFNNGLKVGGRFIDYKFQLIIVFLCIQLMLPLRFLAYPGNIFWTEQGYRFSWRVMLMEKTGYANFKIVDGVTKKYFYVRNDDFLTSFQQKQMATQADFIIEYGQYLGEHFKSQGHKNVEVYVESYASLNGRLSQEYFDGKTDIMKLKNNYFGKNYILPLNE